jgi:hypothetical protein
MKNKFYILLIIALLFINSCDILRISQFEVTSWSPGEGYHPQPENTEVSLSFSHDPNKASIEKYFTLTGNGKRLGGTFIWSEKKVVFSPSIPLEINTDYILNLAANANNTKGLSMDNAFNCEFSTRPDNTRPVLISYSPSLYEEVIEPRAEIKLEFSLPVPVNTLYDNVSFSPSMTGIWTLYDDNKLAVFTPSEPWIQNNKYTMRFSSSLTDINGMNIGNDFSSVFYSKIDHDIPYLLYAQRITKKGEAVNLVPDKGFPNAAQTLIENQDVEKDDKFLLVFSEPVDSVTLKNNLSAEDGPYPVLLNEPGFFKEFICNFESIPVFESRFNLRIKSGIKDSAGNESKEEYVYRIFANGKNSKPPLLIGLRMPMTPKNIYDSSFACSGNESLFMDLPISDINYPSGESVETWIELYFSCAENASIDLFSLMEQFSVDTTNNVLKFSPRHIKTGNFTITEPHSEWKKYKRIEIAGNLTNTANFGIVLFQIAAGLKDSLGNKNEKPQKITFKK